MNITVENKIGQIAANHPLVCRVFARHNIDFCCGGGVSLAVACDKKGIDPKVVLAEIEQELSKSEGTETRWDQASLQDLIQHILTTYHHPLEEELPRLEAMLNKVSRVHGDKDPETFDGLLKAFMPLKEELEHHMKKEEQILFPMIGQGMGDQAGGPISVMHHEHESAGSALATIRSLTKDYTIPEGACNTWRALWHGLEALEKDMHQHIHLENNILFPRALKNMEN